MQRYLRPAGRGSSMDEATLKREDAGVSNIVFLVTLVVMSKEAWLYCIEPFLHILRGFLTLLHKKLLTIREGSKKNALLVVIYY